jgi:acetyl-CoA C-acetyltransferase
MISHSTPIIVGVGQAVDRIDSSDYREMSPADLAAAAAKAAMSDCGLADRIAPHVKAVGSIRTIGDSADFSPPFGKPNKFPLAVARRLGLQPRVAVLEQVGGNSPVNLLTDLGNRIARGESEAALAFGAEATSTIRHLLAAGKSRDWSETIDGDMVDRGSGLEALFPRNARAYGLSTAPALYALLENARRARLGLSIDDYRWKMADLFAPFTAVAAANPYSSSAMQVLSRDELVRVNERNRMIAHPYPLRLVARDQVNQGAAVLLMSVRLARSLAIPESHWVFIHGSAYAAERTILEREDLGAYVAASLALKAALRSAGKTVDEIQIFDFYSCFPIAVFASAIDGLGLKPDDRRGLTVTGGLPYFGGPGNNYSMHAIATAVEKLRICPGKYGLVGLNGGFLSKYGALVLSTDPAEWKDCVHDEIQHRVFEGPVPRVVEDAQGQAHVITFTINYTKGTPTQGIIVGELDSGERFLASNSDETTLAAMSAADSIGRRVHASSTAQGNRFRFAEPAGTRS